MILDVIILVLLVLSVIIGFKLGAARALLSLLGFVVAFLVSVFLGNFLCTLLYDSFVSNAIIEAVTNAVNSEITTLSDAINELPLIARFSLFVTGFELDSSLALNSELPSAIAISVEEMLRPVVKSVLSAVLIFVLFFIVYFIYRLTLYKLLIKMFKLPVLKFFNSLFGAVGGVMILVLFVSLFALILRIVSPFVNHMPFVLSESTIYNSYIFYHFYSGNIFYKLISTL